jgi:uncharacterized protein YqjF (DUF2071 family)
LPHPALARVDHRPWPVPDRPWIWRQRWVDLLFAHWPIPVSVARALVPSPLRVQEFEGTSWVGLVPFRMEDVMVRGAPALPWASAFPEMNLRLYVEYAGKPGVWFVSLDAGNPLAVWGARQFVHLPYFHASMEVRRNGERIHYRSERAGDGPRVAFRATYWPTSEVFEATRGSLAHFLVERYRLYTQDQAGRLLTIEIHHPPWPLQHAAAEIQENAVADPQGIPITGPPLLHFSRRQDVVGWGLERA